MNIEQALQIVSDISSRWGENAEEAFPSRIQASDTDEALAAMVGNDPDELEDAVTVRDLWRALDTVKALLEQRGCEHFDPAVRDGKLTTLCDVVVFG